MPIDFTNLPDKVQPQGKPTSSGVDLSNLPDKGQDESHNHPIWAALARLAGGVGSAMASPADVTVAGTAIPAAISGGSESLAEWLEGSPQSAARIGTEAAIGAVPFAKMVKEGKVLANMGKAAVLGGVGEGAREKAKGEDLSPWQIAGSGALNAATYGLFHKFLGGGGGKPSGPTGPKMDVPPVIDQQPGNKVFRMPPDWEGKVSGAKPTPPTQPPSVVGQHNFANDVRGGVSKAIGKAPNAVNALDDLDNGIQDATKIASQRRASNFRTEVQGQNQENAAHLAEIKRLLGIKKAEELATERAGSGLEPTTTFSESESGVDAAGKRISKNTRFSPPDEEGGGDAGVDPTDNYSIGAIRENNTPENPLEALMRKLGMTGENDPKGDLYANPQKDAPWGGAKFDDLTPGNVDESGFVSAPKVEEPPSPVDALKKVLSPRPSRSVKTVEGFNRALGKNIETGGLPGDGRPRIAQDAPGLTSPSEPSIAPTQPANVAPEPIVSPGEPNGANPPPESPLLKILRTKKGATGANYRMAKEAAAAGEIPSADYARDSHLIQLGKPPEGPFAAPKAPRKPTDLLEQVLEMSKPKQSFDWPEVGGRMEMTPEGSHTLAPIEGGTVEPPVGNPDAGAAGSPDAPDWIRQANEELEAMKKDRGQSGAIAPGLLRLLTAGTGAAIGAPTASYLDPDDPNAGVKGALAGAALGYAGSGGPQELINWRNAGLLATPSAQFKKPLSDIGAYVGHGLEQALSGNRQLAANMGQEALRFPTNISNYVKAFKDPRLAEDVIGDTAKPYIEPAKGLMGIVARPFAAAQYATSQAMQRAGVTPDEAKDTLLLGTPKAELFKKWLDLQKLPGWQGQAVRAVRPFARIGTNLFERGWERIPGISMMTGDPETRVARTLLGTGALAAGALTGHSDEQDMEQGGEPTSPIVRGLRRALLASYGIPFMAGEALAGPGGMRDLAYMVPGLSQTIPMPGPKDNAAAWGEKIGKRWLDQMMPDWLAPQDWEAKPQR